VIALDVCGTVPHMVPDEMAEAEKASREQERLSGSPYYAPIVQPRKEQASVAEHAGNARQFAVARAAPQPRAPPRAGAGPPPPTRST